MDGGVDGGADQMSKGVEHGRRLAADTVVPERVPITDAEGVEHIVDGRLVVRYWLSRSR